MQAPCYILCDILEEAVNNSWLPEDFRRALLSTHERKCQMYICWMHVVGWGGGNMSQTSVLAQRIFLHIVFVTCNSASNEKIDIMKIKKKCRAGAKWRARWDQNHLIFSPGLSSDITVWLDPPPPLSLFVTILLDPPPSLGW